MKKKLYISIPISGKDITEVKLHLDFVKRSYEKGLRY